MRLRYPLAVFSLFVLGVIPIRGDVISYLRFEGDATDETGLMNGEMIDFTNPEVEGWSGDVFAPLIPLTGQANTGSVRFAGGSEFIDLSNNNDLNMGTNFTVEFFLKPDDPIIVSSVFGLGPESSLYFSLWTVDDTLSLRGEFQGYIDSPIEAPTMQTGTWYHVALVKEPGEYTVYLDGVVLYNGALPVGTDGPYFFPGTDITGDRTIGGESGTWRGYIDEFRISDEALTPDQFLIAVPEPGTLFLCFTGLAALFLSWVKRRFG
jgi:hypothetical protein